jgi:hypothetical protein
MNSGIGGVSPRLIGLGLLLSSLNSAFRPSGLPATVEVAKGLEGGYGDEEVKALFNGRRSSTLCARLAVEGNSSMELARLGARESARDVARLESWEAERILLAGRGRIGVVIMWPPMGEAVTIVSREMPGGGVGESVRNRG